MNESPPSVSYVDPVLAEVRRIKEQIARENGYDVRKMAKAAMEGQKIFSDRLVDRSELVKSE